MGVNPPLDSRDASSVRMVQMGEIVGVHGVRGWVKVFSYARPRESLFDFRDWWLCSADERVRYRVSQWKSAGKGLIAKLEGLDDRDTAASLIRQSINIPFADLPALPEGEYYWAELEGLRVITLDGVELGEVGGLMETGANDVLVVSGERERLIPYTPEAVRKIDLDAGTMLVDWDPAF